MVIMFDGMFDKIANELQIMPSELVYVTYDTYSYDPFLFLGIQITDYTSGDTLSINILNIFGDNYGNFVCMNHFYLNH